VIVAPGAWILLSSLDWYITGRACADGTAAWGPLPETGVRLLLLTAAVAAMAAGAWGLTGSLRTWRQVTDRTSLTRAYGYGLAEYLSIAGVVISFVFLLSMALTALPAVVVNICEAGL
jgi:hypothetical protein